MFPMFFIGIPPVPAFFIAKFLEIANFDVLPVQNIWGKIFYMPPCYQLEARYNAVGMGDTQFVGNIGSLFVSIIIVQLMMIVAVITFQLKGCIQQKRLKKGFKKGFKRVFGKDHPFLRQTLRTVHGMPKLNPLF